MQEKEIYDFNLLCACLLKKMKYVKYYPENEDCQLYKVELSLCKHIPSGVINSSPQKSVILKYQIDLKTLNFHDDWNLIMIVISELKNRFSYSYNGRGHSISESLVSIDKVNTVKSIYSFLKYLEKQELLLNPHLF